MYAWFMVARELATQQLAREDAKRATRDAAWIAREMGDVEYRHRTHIGEMEYWPKGAATPDCIPVESLGRDQ